MTITEEDSDENQKDLVYLVNESSEQSSIHPNPASMILVVESMKDQNLMISGINTPNISNYHLNEGSNLLNIENLASGIYFLHLSEENITIKFIKL
jgi:hypothetical protein